MLAFSPVQHSLCPHTHVRTLTLGLNTRSRSGFMKLAPLLLVGLVPARAEGVGRAVREWRGSCWVRVCVCASVC